MSRVLFKGEPRITQGFGSKHPAVDLVRSPSQIEEITAHSAGNVVIAVTGKKNAKGSKGNASYGNYVKIEHKNGYSTLYAHLDKVYVKVGETVQQGQKIGLMGNTGNSYGAHLHFEVRKDNIRINPIPHLSADLPDQADAPAPSKSVSDLAVEVIAGKWGNGSERVNKLTAAGYDAKAVQDAVNKIVAGVKPEPAKKTNEEIANEVYHGLWGNGAERRKRLEDAGYDYDSIQSIVNNIARQKNYYVYSGNSNSIVTALETIGVNSSYGYRRKIAAANGIHFYSGTAAQNIRMLQMLKAGALKRP